MKQADIEIGKEYLTKINGNLCSVKVTSKRKEPESTWHKARTLFGWVRVNPPVGAIKLRGEDTAASLRQAPAKGGVQ